MAAAALRARGDTGFRPRVPAAYAFVMPVVAYWLAEAKSRWAGTMLAILVASVLSVVCCRRACGGSNARSRDGLTGVRLLG